MSLSAALRAKPFSRRPLTPGERVETVFDGVGSVSARLA